MSSYRKHIALIALLLFCFIQTVDLHAFGHDDMSDDHCVLCDFAFESSEFTYLSTDITTLPEDVRTIIVVTSAVYVSARFLQNTSFGFQNKAPPAV